MQDESGYIGKVEKIRLQWNFPEDMVYSIIKADGHCLFRAIAHIMDGNQENWATYRKIAYNEISNNKRYYSGLVSIDKEDRNFSDKEFKYIADHLDGINNFADSVPESAWGGQLDILAIADNLKAKVVVYKSILTIL